MDPNADQMMIFVNLYCFLAVFGFCNYFLSLFVSRVSVDLLRVCDMSCGQKYTRFCLNCGGSVAYIIAMDIAKVNVFLLGTDTRFGCLQGGHILRRCNQ